MRDPTPTGGGVCHRTEAMLVYHSGACDGSPAYAATCSHGRAMTISVMTSTVIAAIIAYLVRLARVGLRQTLRQPKRSNSPGWTKPGDGGDQSTLDSVK